MEKQYAQGKTKGGKGDLSADGIMQPTLPDVKLDDEDRRPSLTRKVSHTDAVGWNEDVYVGTRKSRRSR